MLEDLGNLGDFVGGIGVVVTLVYLAIQIRQNTKQVKQNSRIVGLNAHRDVSKFLTEVLSKVATDPELYRLWRAGFDSPGDLSGDDRERFGMILFQLFTAFENADRFAELEPSLEHRMGPLEDQLLRAPAAVTWWSRQRRNFAGPFKSRIDARIKELAANATDSPNSSPAA